MMVTLYVLTTFGIVQDLHSPNEAKNKHQQHSVKHPQQVEAREAKIDSTKQPSSILPHPGDLCQIRMLGPEQELIHLYRKRRMVCMRLFRPEPTSSCPVPTCSEVVVQNWFRVGKWCPPEPHNAQDHDQLGQWPACLLFPPQASLRDGKSGHQ